MTNRCRSKETTSICSMQSCRSCMKLLSNRDNRYGYWIWIESAARTRWCLPPQGESKTGPSTKDQLKYEITAPEGTIASTRLRLAAEPRSILVDGEPCDDRPWDADSKTLFLRHPAGVKPVTLTIQ